MRRLIVNADDFGFTSGINRGIVEAHTRGIVTSATLMAKGRAFDDAASLAKTVPLLSVGCHIVLIDGEPVLDASAIPSLTTAGSKVQAARFRNNLKWFAAAALTKQLRPKEIEAESSAQIQKVQATGIGVSHVDTHKHTHLFPAVLRPLLRAARACNVRAIRNPFGPRKPLHSSELLRRPGLWTRYAEVRILRTLAARFRDAAQQAEMHTPDGTLGIVVTGALDEKLFRAIASIIPDGTWEFVCHPGYSDYELETSNTRLKQSRETELRVLTMPEAREVLSKSGIELISYREFADNP